MASAVVPVLHAFQAAFSAYNMYLASISITNLQKYEEKSEKAAEWSNIAEHQLHKTRTTQASGTGAIAVTFLSSISLLLYPVFAAALPKYLELGLAGASIVVLLGARRHVGNFWKGKAKVPLPGVGAYNEAITKTQEVRLNMVYLVASWLLTSGLLFIC